MSEYLIGNVIRCAAVFKDAGNILIDPDTVAVDVTDPSKTVTTYVYGTDTEVIKDSVGNYHIDIDAETKGLWKYRFYSTGAGQANKYKTFTITV